MMNFAAARLNMVESQIRPNKVTDPRLVAAMEELPRELFVGKDQRGFAYVDEDLRIAEGRYLVEPMVLARLIQAAQPGPDDVVLDIGCGTGYSTAVLARLAGSVVALESDAGLAETGDRVLTEMGIDNAVVVHGDLAAGYPKQAPYQVILFNGAIAQIPDAVSAQLADDGRLVAVVLGEANVGRAMLMRRDGAVFSSRTLFDAATPLLPGFGRPPRFVF